MRPRPTRRSATSGSWSEVSASTCALRPSRFKCWPVQDLRTGSGRVASGDMRDSGSKASAESSQLAPGAAGRKPSRNVARAASSESGPLTISCPPQCNQSTSARRCAGVNRLGSTPSHNSAAVLVQ